MKKYAIEYNGKVISESDDLELMQWFYRMLQSDNNWLPPALALIKREA